MELDQVQGHFEYEDWHRKNVVVIEIGSRTTGVVGLEGKLVVIVGSSAGATI